MALYLDVPYEEKNEAKRLGAKWNPKVKKWFIDMPRKKYIKFAKWIPKTMSDGIIATEYLYIIEGEQNCWKCGNSTKVVGLAIGDYFYVYADKDYNYSENVDDNIDPGVELHFAWSYDEKEIPPKLLKYLKKQYSVKTGYSKTMEEECFANFCDVCGALQGNWFLFHEPDSPLSSCVGGDELIDRMSKLKIKCIPIKDDLPLNWEIWFCQNDYAYLKYGKSEELILSADLNNKYVSYEELYMK